MHTPVLIVHSPSCIQQPHINPTLTLPSPPHTYTSTLSQLVVPVEEGGRVWEVRVREKAPVITLMFKVAEAAGVTLTLTSAIFEICETLKIRT